MKKKLVNIIKSRLIDGDDLPDWYRERNDKCANCPFNSSHPDNRTLKVKAWEKVAGVHCVKCKCTIKEKTKIKDEECPLQKWLNIYKMENNDLNIKVTSGDAEIQYASEAGFYLLAYNNDLKYGEDTSKIELEVTDKDAKITSINTSCGCTGATNKEGKITVSYDTKRLGSISKTITIRFDKNGEQGSTKIKLMGKVNY